MATELWNASLVPLAGTKTGRNDGILPLTLHAKVATVASMLKIGAKQRADRVRTAIIGKRPGRKRPAPLLKT